MPGLLPELSDRDASRDLSTTRGRPGRALLWGVALGVVLGAAACGADALPVGPRQFASPLFSTGLVWGAGAIFASSRASGLISAAVTGIGTLLAATWVYYGAVLVFGMRPDAGSASVLRAAAVWTIVSLVAGVMGGLAGWWAVNGSIPTRSVTTGLIAGALGAQGVFELLRASGYILEPNARAALVTSVLLTAVPLGILVLRRRAVLMRIALPVAAASLAFGAAAWAGVIGVLGAL